MHISTHPLASWNVSRGNVPVSSDHRFVPSEHDRDGADILRHRPTQMVDRVRLQGGLRRSSMRQGHQRVLAVSVPRLQTVSLDSQRRIRVRVSARAGRTHLHGNRDGPDGQNSHHLPAGPAADAQLHPGRSAAEAGLFQRIFVHFLFAGRIPGEEDGTESKIQDSRKSWKSHVSSGQRLV